METTSTLDLVGYIATLPNLLICAAVWSCIQLVTRTWPQYFATKLALRIKPFAAVVICVGLCLMPGVQPADLSSGNKVLLGVVLGSFAGQVHKVIKQSIFGHGVERKAHKEKDELP